MAEHSAYALSNNTMKYGNDSRIYWYMRYQGDVTKKDDIHSSFKAFHWICSLLEGWCCSSAIHEIRNNPGSWNVSATLVPEVLDGLR